MTAKARAEKVAAFTAEHPEAFIMDVWGFGDRTKINPVIAGADSGVRVWCINSHEVTKTAAEAAQKLCKTTKSGPTTIAIYGGNFANVDFSTNTSGSGSLELTVQRWGKNKYKGLEKMFAGFHAVEFADDAGMPDLSQATSIEQIFEYVNSIIGDLNKWDVSNIENFSSAFHDSQFNGDISKWDTRNATTMNDMFMSAFYFNGDISRWNTSRVTNMEAYSAAGEMRFGWWLVEHYLSYHVNCPDGCVSGEPARGRKDPPYFQMGYGSFDNIPDLVDTLVESLLPVQ